MGYIIGDGGIRTDQDKISLPTSHKSLRSFLWLAEWYGKRQLCFSIYSFYQSFTKQGLICEDSRRSDCWKFPCCPRPKWASLFCHWKYICLYSVICAKISFCIALFAAATSPLSVGSCSWPAGATSRKTFRSIFLDFHHFWNSRATHTKLVAWF